MLFHKNIYIYIYIFLWKKDSGQSCFWGTASETRNNFFLFTNLEAIYNCLKRCTEMTRGDKKARLRERKRHRARRHSVAVKDEETVGLGAMVLADVLRRLAWAAGQHSRCRHGGRHEFWHHFPVMHTLGGCSLYASSCPILSFRRPLQETTS